MAFCTYYTYNGEIRHCDKRSLRDINEKSELVMEHIKNEIKMLAITTPPASGVIDFDGTKALWGDYVTCRINDLFNDFEDEYYKQIVTGQALEAMQENPANVTDDGDEQ